MLNAPRRCFSRSGWRRRPVLPLKRLLRLAALQDRSDVISRRRPSRQLAAVGVVKDAAEGESAAYHNYWDSFRVRARGSFSGA